MIQLNSSLEISINSFMSPYVLYYVTILYLINISLIKGVNLQCSWLVPHTNF